MPKSKKGFARDQLNPISSIIRDKTGLKKGFLCGPLNADTFEKLFTPKMLPPSNKALLVKKLLLFISPSSKPF
jgi:hypothetical protein